MCAPLMILFRLPAKRTVSECVAGLQPRDEGRRGTNSLPKYSIRHFASRRVPSLENVGRRGVCRLAYKGQLIARASTFENLVKQKQAGLKVNRASQAIQCMLLRCDGHMAIEPRDQVVLVPLRLHCGCIGQAIERSPGTQNRSLHSQQGAPEDDQRNQEIDAEPRNIHQGGYERSRARGGVESQTSEEERQHASRQRSEHDNSDEARPDRKAEQNIVFPIILEV